MMESDFETFPALPCPRAGDGLFDPRDTWSVYLPVKQNKTPRGHNELTLDRKSMPIVAWYILSNESYINRVISEVFPTA